MQFVEDADLVTSTGEKIGRVDRVVIDPQSHEVTHVVVKKGLLLTREKVVSVEQIDTATEEKVILKKGIDDPDKLPDFEEKHYIPINRPGVEQGRLPEYPSPVVWYYPVPGIPWRGTGPYGPYASYSEPPYVIKTERNIPDHTVALEQGSSVYSKNGEHVGDVKRIYTEPKENRATHLLISRGVLTKESKLIPTFWIDKVTENAIRLSVDTDVIDRLPEYSPSE